MSEKPTKTAQGGPAGRGFYGLLLWLGVAALMVAAFPTFLVVAVGLTPTLVALIGDRGGEKDATRCMAAFNLAGLAPTLLMLWQGEHSLDMALTLLSDVYNWLFILGAAAVAAILLWIMPKFFEIALATAARHQAAALRRRQNALLEEWGREIVDDEAVEDAQVS